jgi:glyoxylase-like metal-dependent hydrolase (beta-lactamase superfamily II)
VKEYQARHKLSVAAHLGGAASMYPEITTRVNATAADAALLRPAAGVKVTSQAVDPEPRDGQIHVWPLRGSLHMLTGDAGNIVVQVGDEGPIVIDSGSGRLSSQTVQAIRRLSDKPIQFIVNTGFHPDRTGGNAALQASGSDPSVRGSFFSLQFRDAGVGATIIAHQNVQNRMTALKVDPRGIPSDTYLEERRRTFHNGDSIELFWQKNAVTDGDSLVHFRRADVLVTGNVFTTTQFPFIDVANGGTIDGEIRALNDILSRTVYEHEGEGGTIVVPGHGYVSDEHEVVEYRDMVVIVRDRVRAMMRSGSTLDQIKAARPTADYDTRYGATSGPWTTDQFVEAVYRTLNTR